MENELLYPTLLLWYLQVTVGEKKESWSKQTPHELKNPTVGIFFNPPLLNSFAKKQAVEITKDKKGQASMQRHCNVIRCISPLVV